MPENLTRDEFLTHIELLHGGIKGVHDRLDTQNGRIRQAETDIAVLKERSGSDVIARIGAALGAAGAAAFAWWK